MSLLISVVSNRISEVNFVSVSLGLALMKHEFRLVKIQNPIGRLPFVGFINLNKYTVTRNYNFRRKMPTLRIAVSSSKDLRRDLNLHGLKYKVRKNVPTFRTIFSSII